MAVPRKFVVAANAATRELWRVVENGEIEELADLLPQANINARNEHGMTALMRAAYHGRVEMVRVLLEHGADPNLRRNDNFTALSLAAFFGHTEIVEMLMGHGAETDVATRYGTSAQMWAKARSFGDVAQCLQKRRTEQVVLPAPVRTPAPPTLTPTPSPTPMLKPERQFELEPETEREIAQPEFEPSIPAVRTLSEPPEIWDLVHEAPRDFSAGTAFVSRVGSITAGVVLGIVAFVVVAAGIVGVWYWKDRTAHPITATSPPPVITSVTERAPVAAAPVPTAPNAATAAIPATATTESNPTDLPSFTVSEPVVPRIATRRKPRITQAPVEPTPTAPPVAIAPKIETPNATANKPAAPQSPQLIAPPKTQPQQPKGKVIQWP